jgi:arabinose-5-phosphate isomerase
MINTQEFIESIIRRECDAVSNIPITDGYTTAIGYIHHYVHDCGGKLVTSGMGKAGQIALNIATTFSSTGTPAVFLHPSDSQHGDLGVLQSNDVLLLISNSGKTQEVLDLIDLSGNLHHGLPIIVITGHEDSPLAQRAHVALLTGNPDEICPLGMTPTTSTTVMTVMGDILIAMMMDKIQFTQEEYAKRHHGGYLGVKARSSS